MCLERLPGRLSLQPVTICCVPPLADAAAVDATINFCKISTYLVTLIA